MYYECIVVKNFSVNFVHKAGLFIHIGRNNNTGRRRIFYIEQSLFLVCKPGIQLICPLTAYIPLCIKIISVMIVMMFNVSYLNIIDHLVQPSTRQFVISSI